MTSDTTKMIAAARRPTPPKISARYEMLMLMPSASINEAALIVNSSGSSFMYSLLDISSLEKNEMPFNSNPSSISAEEVPM